MADRTCRECGATKADEAFVVRRGKVTSWCRDCSRAYHRDYKRRHRPPRQTRQPAKTPVERTLAYARTEKGRAARAKWRAANRERERAARRQWKDRNRLLVNEYDQRRRFAEANAVRENLDPVEIGDRDGWTCYLCERSVAVVDATLDHIVPLVRGGSHTADNVAITHLTCNQSKGERWLGDFLGFVEPGRCKRAAYPDLVRFG